MLISFSVPFLSLAANGTDCTLSEVILWKVLTISVRRFICNLVDKNKPPKTSGAGVIELELYLRDRVSEKRWIRGNVSC